MSYSASELIGKNSEMFCEVWVTACSREPRGVAALTKPSQALPICRFGAESRVPPTVPLWSPHRGPRPIHLFKGGHKGRDRWIDDCLAVQSCNFNRKENTSFVHSYTYIYAKLISLVFNPKLITTMNKIPNSFARFPEETIGQHSDKCLCISFLEGKPKKVFFKRSLRRCLQLLGMGKACQALLKPHKIWNLHADRQPINRKRYICYWITHVTIKSTASIHPLQKEKMGEKLFA